MAEQIINVDNKKFVLIKKTLEEILLKDEIRNLPVVVLSIVGAYRKGKSFLLNFFLRFLHATCKEKKSAENWLNSSNEPLSGFKWTHSTIRQTVGIMIWPEIFVLKLPSDEEVAVVLLDTQGIFDNQTSVDECAAIFALSTLLSSVQIFNLVGNVNLNDLTSLKDFLKYGQLLRDEESTKVPFQTLLFLIRDWPYPQEHSYGRTGGQNYVDVLLNGSTNEHGQKVSEDVDFVKKSLKTYFRRVEGFLLPDPGRKVVLEGTDKLEEIDDEFKNYVQTLISDIFKPENLSVKKIDDKKVTVGELVLLIGEYHEHFQNGKVPNLQFIYEATAKLQNSSILEQSIKKFKNLMNENDIKNVNTESISDEDLSHKFLINRRLIIDEYKKIKKMGGEIMNQKYHLKFCDQLDALHLEYSEFNSIKYKRELQRKEYEEKIREENKIKEYHKQIEEESLKLLELELAQWEALFKEEERNKEEKKLRTVSN